MYIDAVHYAPHGLIDVKRTRLRFSGVLALQVFRTAHGRRSTESASTCSGSGHTKCAPCTDQVPDRWETGTQIHELIAGIGAAVEYIAELGGTAIHPSKRGATALAAAYRTTVAHETAPDFAAD